jgi:predicted esterase
VWAVNGDVEGPSAVAVDSTSIEVFKMGGSGRPRSDLFPIRFASYPRWPTKSRRTTWISPRGRLDNGEGWTPR